MRQVSASEAVPHLPSADSSGAWVMHPVLILATKLLVDAIPGMTQDVSWTIVNLGYMAVSRPSTLLLEGWI